MDMGIDQARKHARAGKVHHLGRRPGQPYRPGLVADLDDPAAFHRHRFGFRPRGIGGGAVHG